MPALNLTLSDELSELEATVLDHLARTLRPGFCPSREEISQAVGLGRRGYHITKLLDSLVEKSYIRLEPGRFRAITVLRRPDGRRFSLDTFWAPLVGQIVASKPLPSVGQLDNPFAGEAVELTRSLVRGRDDVFALRLAVTACAADRVGEMRLAEGPAFIPQPAGGVKSSETSWTIAGARRGVNGRA